MVIASSSSTTIVITSIIITTVVIVIINIAITISLIIYYNHHYHQDINIISNVITIIYINNMLVSKMKITEMQYSILYIQQNNLLHVIFSCFQQHYGGSNSRTPGYPINQRINHICCALSTPISVNFPAQYTGISVVSTEQQALPQGSLLIISLALKFRNFGFMFVLCIVMMHQILSWSLLTVTYTWCLNICDL